MLISNILGPDIYTKIMKYRESFKTIDGDKTLIEMDLSNINDILGSTIRYLLLFNSLNGEIDELFTNIYLNYNINTSLAKQDKKVEEKDKENRKILIKEGLINIKETHLSRNFEKNLNFNVIKNDFIVYNFIDILISRLNELRSLHPYTKDYEFNLEMSQEIIQRIYSLLSLYYPDNIHVQNYFKLASGNYKILKQIYKNKNSDFYKEIQSIKKHYQSKSALRRYLY